MLHPVEQRISKTVVAPLKNAMEACETEKRDAVSQVTKAISKQHARVLVRVNVRVSARVSMPMRK
jgi:hypothetical protein